MAQDVGRIGHKWTGAQMGLWRQWRPGGAGVSQGHAQYVVAGGGMALDVVVARLARDLHQVLMNIGHIK